MIHRNGSITKRKNPIPLTLLFTFNQSEPNPLLLLGVARITTQSHTAPTAYQYQAPPLPPQTDHYRKTRPPQISRASETWKLWIPSLSNAVSLKKKSTRWAIRCRHTIRGDIPSRGMLSRFQTWDCHRRKMSRCAVVYLPRAWADCIVTTNIWWNPDQGYNQTLRVFLIEVGVISPRIRMHFSYFDTPPTPRSVHILISEEKRVRRSSNGGRSYSWDASVSP